MPVAEEEAMVVHAAPVFGFWLLQAEQQYNLTLLEEHRLEEAQLDVERTRLTMLPRPWLRHTQTSLM